MPESIRFQSEEELNEIATAEKLKTDGGIFYEERIDPETNESTRIVNILGIEIPTYASEEDIEAIKDEMVLSKVDQELLKTIAECYELRQALLFEGDPGVGKTFLMKKFVQLVHGKDAPILELYGTPKTSELEILGHWSPKGLTEQQMSDYKELLKQSMSNHDMVRLNEDLNAQLERLNEQFTSGQLEEGAFQEQFGDITSHYVNESKTILFQIGQIAGFSQDKSEWEFRPGALLQAYAGRDGDGYPLICDEFNMIPSNYQQIFLQIGGNQGALSDSVSFWGNSGKTNYHRGKDTWVCFASNFPEKTPGRSEVVAPMSDRLVWKVISQEDVAVKKETIIKSAGGRLGRKTKESSVVEAQPPISEQIKWDEVLDERLGEEIAEIIYLLDDNFGKFYNDVGDTVEMKGQERRRTQQMEFSGRNALRLFSYLDHFQVRNAETGMVDFGKTIENAFRRYYVERLANPAAREKMMAIFTELMDGKLGMKMNDDQSTDLELRGKLNESFGFRVEESQKPMTRREILDENVKSLEGKAIRKYDNLYVIGFQKDYGQSIERAFKVISKESPEIKAVFVDLEQDRERQDSLGEAYFRIPQAMSRVKKLVESGVSCPIIMTSLLDESDFDHIVKPGQSNRFSESLKELEPYPNVRFFKAPINLKEIREFIEEVEKSNNN